MYGIDFYPTRPETIEKLLDGIDFKTINNMLEPNCGDGAIVDYIREKCKTINTYKKVHVDMDCIEIDPNLRHILQGKNYRVVADDFLQFNTLKAYDLIAMNPPFSNQEHHIKKAIELLLNSGGELRAIVNSSMIKNPYSNIRKEIINILESNNADIEFYESEFSDARRETDVEIAIIKCKFAKKEVGSVILENLKQAELEAEDTYTSNYIVENDFFKAIIKQYNFECKTGINLIKEYNKLKSFTSSEFNKEDSSILSLRIGSDRSYSEPSENLLINNYLKEVRRKYWTALFNNKEFTKLFTSNLQRDFYNRLNELTNYDFNEFNINELRRQMNLQVVTGVKETILKLFDEFSRKHSLDSGGNIHYYNGWKTNSCWKINKRIVLPLNSYGTWNDRFDPTHYQCIDKLSDIEKVFNYLDTGKTEELTLREILQKAKDNNQTKGVITKFFKINFYSKTVHLTFLDLDLLKKFNIFGAMNKNWLMPSYGKKRYEDMTQEEREVIDEFEGKKEYDKTLKNNEFYIYNPSKILMLN